MSIGKNMMLINSAFKNVKSFSLVPASLECPYVEAMYDPTSSILAVISKDKKDSLHMVPLLDNSGNPIKGKMKRIQIETFSEFYVQSKEDIANFIEIFAINSEHFDYKKFFVDVNETKVSPIITQA